MNKCKNKTSGWWLFGPMLLVDVVLIGAILAVRPPAAVGAALGGVAGMAAAGIGAIAWMWMDIQRMRQEREENP